MSYRSDTPHLHWLSRTTSRQTKKLFIAAGLLSAIVLFLITVSVQDQRFKANEILTQGITVPAVVTETDITLPQTGSRAKAVGIRFTDADGQTQEQQTWQFLGWGERRRLQVGTPVAIVYLPHRTYTPFVKDALVRVAGSGWVAALTGIGTLLAFTAFLWGCFLKAPPEPTPPDDFFTPQAD